MAVSRVVLAVLLALPLVALAADNFKAQMNGASVVPTPIPTQVSGTAQLNFDRHLISRSTVSYSVSLGRTEGVQSVQLKYGAQGYLDPNAGKSDLLAYLYGPSNTPSAPNPITGTLKREDLLGGLSGKTINDLQKNADDKMLYILVTTKNNPTGAIRGQVVAA